MHNQIIKYSETPYQATIEIKKPSLRYLDEFVKLKCAYDLLRLKLFPNAKEITESMAAYNAYRKYFFKELRPDDPNVLCVVVGDGHVPRTGALFAHRTNWQVVSVDPLMYKNKIQVCKFEPQGIKRLLVFQDKIEDTYITPIYNKILVVCVHSHAKLSESIKNFKNRKVYLINIPCCYPSDLDRKPDVEYDDWGIHSEKRRIEIYYPEK